MCNTLPMRTVGRGDIVLWSTNPQATQTHPTTLSEVINIASTASSRKEFTRARPIKGSTEDTKPNAVYGLASDSMCNNLLPMIKGGRGDIARWSASSQATQTQYPLATSEQTHRLELGAYSVPLTGNLRAWWWIIWYLWNGNVSQVPCISRVTLIPSCLKPNPQYAQCVLACWWKDLGSSWGSARISSYALLYLAMYSASTLCAGRLTRMGNGWSSNEKSLMGRAGSGGQQCGWTLWGGTTAFCLHVYMSGPILGAPSTP